MISIDSDSLCEAFTAHSRLALCTFCACQRLRHLQQQQCHMRQQQLQQCNLCKCHTHTHIETHTHSRCRRTHQRQVEAKLSRLEPLLHCLTHWLSHSLPPPLARRLRRRQTLASHYMATILKTINK